MKHEFDRFLAALAGTEWLPPRELARYQQELLIRLVRHARDRVPFYRERLAGLFTSAGDIDLSRWNDVPVLARDEVIAHGEAMRVPELSAEYGEVAEAQTSGTTGEPLRVATNGLVFFAGNALLTRAARWLGMDTARPLATLACFGKGPGAPGPDGAVKTGWSLTDPHTPHYEFELLTPVNRHLEWLARCRPSYLMTQPSGALNLADAATPEQARDLGLQNVLLIGECVPEGTHEIISARLGARAGAIYSCQEIGHIAAECGSAPHYHVAAENALVEVLDDGGSDVAPGQRGRVIVTGLYNYAMPFIRYELGDLAVTATEPCPCGRSLPLLTRIEGRMRNAFLFRDGRRVWPRPETMRRIWPFVPWRRYQLVQRDLDTIEFRYVPDGSGRTPDLAGLNAFARSEFHPSVKVMLVAVDALRPGPSGKFEEFLSHVLPASTAQFAPQNVPPAST